MMTREGPKVLEFNCRFGDPETQAILPRLATDLVPALEACIDGRLDPALLRWKDEACVCVVMAADGYPGAYRKGQAIRGLEQAAGLPDAVVFHAGTRLDNGRVVTAGGRVLGVTGLGADLKEAIRTAYDAVGAIRFEGQMYRRDIGARALRGQRP
jgi:phosphoribosylamine--glycine ligase